MYESSNFVQSLDLVRPKSFPTAFEWPKSVKSYSSYMSAEKSVEKSATGTRKSKEYHH